MKMNDNNETLFAFGKFEGHTVKELLDCDSIRKYIWWCLDNVKGFTITEEEKKLLGPGFSSGYSYETDPFDPDCPNFEG